MRKDAEFVAVSRVLGSSVDTTFNAIDLGTRVLYTAGRYALSAEGSFRSFTGTARLPTSIGSPRLWI